MKFFRQTCNNPIVLFFLILTMLLSSCGRDQVASKASQISGKELFRAIYFLDGKLLDSIEPLNGLKLESLFDDQQIKIVRGQIETLLDSIEIIHPGTFDLFKADMTSGDQMTIKESISRNASLIYSSIREIKKNDELFLNLTKSGEQPLVKLVERHFLSNSNAKTITIDQIKEDVKSDSFRKDLSNYFKNLDDKLNGRTNSVESQMCSIVVGAAVLVVASIAVVVIYVVAVLNALWLANAVDVVWGGPSNRRVDGSSSLIAEQIVNSIAMNFNHNK